MAQRQRGCAHSRGRSLADAAPSRSSASGAHGRRRGGAAARQAPSGLRGALAAQRRACASKALCLALDEGAPHLHTHGPDCSTPPWRADAGNAAGTLAYQRSPKQEGQAHVHLAAGRGRRGAYGNAGSYSGRQTPSVGGDRSFVDRWLFVLSHTHVFPATAAAAAAHTGANNFLHVHRKTERALLAMGSSPAMLRARPAWYGPV